MLVAFGTEHLCRALTNQTLKVGVRWWLYGIGERVEYRPYLIHVDVEKCAS